MSLYDHFQQAPIMNLEENVWSGCTVRATLMHFDWNKTKLALPFMSPPWLITNTPVSLALPPLLWKPHLCYLDHVVIGPSPHSCAFQQLLTVQRKIIISQIWPLWKTFSSTSVLLRVALVLRKEDAYYSLSILPVHSLLHYSFISQEIFKAPRALYF